MTLQAEIHKNLKFNWIVNLLDGSFFGFALGFASFVTIIPLFVSNMTDSAILIGLIPAIHSVGWQFPQLLMANRTARQARYMPMVMALTVQERLPFLGLAAVAWFQPRLGAQAALTLTFLLLIWQGLGAGFTANAWQTMIGKIFPSDRRGTFLGAQSAIANVLASISAVLAGVILERLPSPQDYTLCFLLGSVNMGISWYFLSRTREPESPPAQASQGGAAFWKNLLSILRRDGNFRWFLLARSLSMLAVMAFSFYTVYAVQHHGMNEVEVGVATGVLMGAQIVMNPLMGWLGDRWSHRGLMEIGMLAAAVSALLAWLAPSPAWFFVVYILAGVANVAIWTIGITMIMDFGVEAERPSYIGLANTLVAPVAILAPFIGGWLADSAGYPATFVASALGAFATILVLHLRVRDPRRAAATLAPPELLAGENG